jgi:putative hydrolase of HD superfamily
VENKRDKHPAKLSALMDIFTLKDRLRTGWVLREVSAPESVADHSWGTAFLCLLFADDEGVDRQRVLSIALVHDLAESITGDVATRVYADEQAVAREEKQKREKEAMGRITGGLIEAPGGVELQTLWQEYEDGETREAKFVRDMNLIDMCLQALKYEREGRYSESEDNPHFRHFRGLDEFFATSGPRIATPTGRRLYDAIHAAYREARGGCGNQGLSFFD